MTRKHELRDAPFDEGKMQPAVAPELMSEALANEESETLRRKAATRLFAEDWWPLERVLRWIAFRDPTRIEDSWQAERRYAQRDVLSKDS